MRIALLVPAFTCLLCASTSGDKPIKGAALTWRPTHPLSESLGTLNLTPYTGVKIAFKGLSDQRKVKDLVGENQEHDEPIPVTTRNDVSAFIAEHLLDLLRESGLPMVDKADPAQVVISGEVMQFFVAERNTYDGVCQLVIQVEAKGKVLWRGSVMGHATRWGRSMKLENYCEALSNSVMECVTNLLKDPAFLKALAEGGASAP